MKLREKNSYACPVRLHHSIIIQKEPPSLQDYKSFLLPKTVVDQNWQRVIEKAASKNMDGEKVGRLIDLFADMVQKA